MVVIVTSYPVAIAMAIFYTGPQTLLVAGLQIYLKQVRLITLMPLCVCVCAAVCGNLAKCYHKDVHMNIIMWLGSPFSL